MQGIGAAVRMARLEQGLTQEMLAVQAEVCSATVRGIELGTREPRRTTLRALERVLGPLPASREVGE